MHSFNNTVLNISNSLHNNLKYTNKPNVIAIEKTVLVLCDRLYFAKNGN